MTETRNHLRLRSPLEFHEKSVKMFDCAIDNLRQCSQQPQAFISQLVSTFLGEQCACCKTQSAGPLFMHRGLV